MDDEKKYKRAGKREEGSQEELEFIYSRLQHLSDREILDEMQDETFPLRSLGFIKRRRREFNAAKKVLEQQVKKEVDPVLAERRKEHWDRLASTAEKLDKELSWMPDFPHLRLEHTTRAVYLKPFEGWIYDHDKLSNEPVIRLGIEYTNPLLFEGLLSHLEAEFPQFDLRDWKGDAGKLMQEWYSLIAEVSERYVERTGMGVSEHLEAGLTPFLAPFHCDWLVNNFGHKGQYIELETSQTSGQPALELHPKGLPAWPLAYGDANQIEECQKATRAITDLYIEGPRVGDLANQIKQVNEKTRELRSMITLVVERRTFQGSCAICLPWSA